MVLSKRERYIAIITGVVLAVLVLDHLVVSPLMAQRVELDTQIATQRKELGDAKRLFDTSRRMNRRWADMAGGQMTRNASEAESQVLHSVRDWAQDAGLALSSVKPERSEKEKDFNKITFRATGTGTMSQVGRFLWRIQTATIPVRVNDLQLSAHKEGSDDLTLQVAISTIHQPPAAGTGAGSGTGASATLAGQETRP